jgi:hypothetical protein
MRDGWADGSEFVSSLFSSPLSCAYRVRVSLVSQEPIAYNQASLISANTRSVISSVSCPPVIQLSRRLSPNLRHQRPNRSSLEWGLAFGSPTIVIAASGSHHQRDYRRPGPSLPLPMVSSSALDRNTLQASSLGQPEERVASFTNVTGPHSPKIFCLFLVAALLLLRLLLF